VVETLGRGDFVYLRGGHKEILAAANAGQKHNRRELNASSRAVHGR
jgi:hypothetical protein